MEPIILVIGESLIDVVEGPDGVCRRLPGGSPLNVAIGLGRLGHHPTMATWYGQDSDGRLIEAHAEASNVWILPGCDQASHTSTATARLSADGSATYEFDLEWQMPIIPQTEAPLLIHTGSLGALLRPGGDDVLAYIHAGRPNSIVTFDPNCRPSIMDAPELVRVGAELYAANADLVKVSEEDLAWLYPEASGRAELLAKGRDWLAMGPSAVVVTLGGDGAIIQLDGLTDISIAADQRHGLVDTVGAGDSFMAGLIHGLINHGYATPGRRGHFGDDVHDLAAIALQAATIAGVTVSRAGANPPWINEIEPLLADITPSPWFTES
ncbi:MAG: PfkB family carbohydrate kinase [Propionibacteriaceae bacterium]|jgi:fructokinase|nr:PfkB family carbohydrate kinase [Propionibacteriaceae bacterium]